MSTTTAVPVLQARGLSRQFGSVRALNNVDFEVYPGEVTALIGDNGAGKSTLVKALSGNLAVDEGEIRFDGSPIDMSNPQVASSLGIETVYQDLALAPHLDPVQNMYLGREIRRPGLSGALGFMKTKDMAKASREAFDELGATVRSLTSPVGEMSGGQRQAIAIAHAVHWAGRLVFLDEPTAALDPQARRNLWDLLSGLNDSGRTVVLTTHYMDEAEVLCDRVAIMDGGRLLQVGTPAALVRGLDAPARITVAPGVLTPEEAAAVPGVEHADAEHDGVVLTTRQPAAVIGHLAERDRLDGVRVQTGTLEDVFLELTGREYRA